MTCVVQKRYMSKIQDFNNIEFNSVVQNTSYLFCIQIEILE